MASHPQEHSYLNHYIALTDSIYKENRAEEVGKIQQKYDNEVLARTNDQLYFKWILTSVVGSLICIIAVTFLQKMEKGKCSAKTNRRIGREEEGTN